MNSGELYTICPCGESDGLRVFTARLDPSHAVFAGHFPGNPVMPGICTLMMVRRCVEMALGTRLSYAHVRDSKFVSAIVPDGNPLTVSVKITPRAEGDMCDIDATVSGDGTLKLKLKASLKSDE